MKRNSITLLFLFTIMAGCKDKDVDADWAEEVAGTYVGVSNLLFDNYSEVNRDIEFKLERVSAKSLMLIMNYNQGQVITPEPIEMTEKNLFRGEYVNEIGIYEVIEGRIRENALTVKTLWYTDGRKADYRGEEEFLGVRK